MLEFPLGGFEAVGCKTSGTGRDRRPCSLNVVVLDWSVWCGDLSEGGELRQQLEIGIVAVLEGERDEERCQWREYPVLVVACWCLIASCQPSVQSDVENPHQGLAS